MSLRFEQKPAEGRLARGLEARVMETFHYAYVGKCEFAHFFCVPCSTGEVWRWTLLIFPGMSIGEAASKEEASRVIEDLYRDMLEMTGLMERPKKRLSAGA